MTRKLIALLPLLFIGLLATAQTNQKLSKAERKAVRKEKQEANFKRILEAIENKEFVVEAHTITNRRGFSVPVSPNTNFVGISGDGGVIQFAFGNGPGFNGLGGLTTDGKIVKYELIEQKKGISLKMRLFGSAFGSTDLILSVNSSGNATVKVNTLRGGRFTFNGAFRDLETANVFQGNSIY